MDKIRLGNDIEMRWSIFTRDGDNKVPYNLEGRALTLSVVNRTGESEIEFFAEGNIVTGVFRGRDQKIIGKHGVILRENNGKDGMRTIDACDAFELVACSCEEALGSSGTIQLFHLTFDSTIGAITGTIDPILNYEAEQAEAERKANEIIRKANEGQRIDNEKQRNVNEILRNTAEEERKDAEQERIVNEDLRKADETDRKTNEESRVHNESERISSEEERLYGESIRVANENARIASEAKRKEAETARIEAEDKRIVSEKSRLSAESSRIANEDSRRANEDSRLSAEAKRVSAEEGRQIAEEERQAKFASMVVQTTGDATDKVMSQKAVTEALKDKQNKLTAGKGISIDGDVISCTLDIFRIVNALPSVGEANLIYLVPAEQPSESDLFEEWVWKGAWERIGSAKIDLSGYFTKEEVERLLAAKQDSLTDTDGSYGQRVAKLEEGKQDVIDDLEAIRDNASLGKSASESLSTLIVQALGDSADNVISQQAISAIINRLYRLLGYNDSSRTITLEQGIPGKYVKCATRSAVANSKFAISKPFEVEACEELLIKTGFNPSSSDYSGLDLTIIAIYEQIPRSRLVHKKDSSGNLLYYAITVDEETGTESVTTEETTTVTAYPVMTTEEYIEERYLPNNEDRFVAIPDSGYYVANIPQSCKVVISYMPGVTDMQVIAEKHGALANLVSQTFGIYEHRTMVEAVVSLEARLSALEASRGLLGHATAGSLDVCDLTRYRYPLVMYGHGVPSAANIPVNLPEGLPWDGAPIFVGQIYINMDATSAGLYYAKDNKSVADWKQA